MNLAARLMSYKDSVIAGTSSLTLAIKSSILCDESTYLACRGSAIAFAEPMLVHLKGFQHRIQVQQSSHAPGHVAVERPDVLYFCKEYVEFDRHWGGPNFQSVYPQLPWVGSKRLSSAFRVDYAVTTFRAGCWAPGFLERPYTVGGGAKRI